MSFTILNEANAADADQAEWDEVDIDILIAGLLGDGVVSGCEVTQDDGGASQDVSVDAGVVRVNGVNVAVSAVDVTLSDATGYTSGYQAYDLVTVNSAGTVALTAGTAAPAGVQVFPSIPANSVVLAAVLRNEGDNTIVDDDVTDKRAQPPLSGGTGRVLLDGSTLYGGSDNGDTLTLQGNETDRYDPIVLNSPLHFFGGDTTIDDTSGFGATSFGIPAGNTYTIDVANFALVFLRVGGTFLWEQNPFIYGGMNLFFNNATHKNPAGESRTWSALRGYVDQPTWQVDTQTGETFPVYESFLSSPNMDRINSGTGTMTELNQYRAKGGNTGVGTGMTLTDRFGFRADDFATLGTLTNQVGFVAADLTNATNNVGFLEGTTTVPTITGGGTYGGYFSNYLRIPVYTDSTRGTASNFAAGTMIFNSDDGAPNWSDGTNWVDGTGSTT